MHVPGYDIRNNNRESGRLLQSSWEKSKAAAKRQVDYTYNAILGSGSKYTNDLLLVVAVDPNTGEVVAGRIETR